MRLRFSIALGVFALSSAAFPRSAWAIDPDAGLAIERLDRPEAGSRFYATDTLALRDPWMPAFGVQTNYSFRAFSIIEPDGTRFSLVRNMWSMDADAGIVIPGGLRLGLSMPLALYEDGRDTVIGNSQVLAPTYPAAGDLRIAGDVFVRGGKDDPFSLAIGVAVYLPTGSLSSFMSDSTARVYPRALMTGKYRYLRWGLRVGYMLRPHEEFLGGVELGSEALLGASAGVEKGPFVFGPELMGSTVVSSASGLFTKETTPIEALLSGHYSITNKIVAGAGVGTRLTDGLGAAAFRAVMSLEYVPFKVIVRDRDGDGIPDEQDHCPDVPGCDPDNLGCPAPLIDSNGDGVPDMEPICLTLPDGRNKAAPPVPRPWQKPAPPTLDPCERVDAPEGECERTAPKERESPENPPLPPQRTWGD
jgi:hypothetical protein